MLQHILIALSIFILMVSVAPLDEPLSAQARDTLALVPNQTTHRAVLYRAGLNAPENLDPSVYGQHRLRGISSSGSTSTPGTRQASSLQGLRSPRGPFFCSLHENSRCWNQIVSVTAEALSMLEKDHATLLSRYQTWLKISDTENKTIGLSPESSLPVEHLSGVHRLMVLRAFYDAAQGQAAASLERLYRVISDLRQHFALPDDFPAKLILAELIDESLQAASVISRTYHVKTPPIPRLSPQEKDLSSAMAHQFRKASHFFLSIEALNVSDPKHTEEPRLKWMMRFAMQRLIYKPKQTLNRTHQALQFWMEASRASPAHFARLMEQEFHPGPVALVWDQLRNPLGRILGQLAELNFKIPIVRLQQLDIMIAMFNATQGQALEQLSSEALANPYGQGAPAALSANRSALCMPSPDVIHTKATCLRLGA